MFKVLLECRIPVQINLTAVKFCRPLYCSRATKEQQPVQWTAVLCGTIVIVCTDLLLTLLLPLVITNINVYINQSCNKLPKCSNNHYRSWLEMSRCYEHESSKGRLQKNINGKQNDIGHFSVRPPYPMDSDIKSSDKNI